MLLISNNERKEEVLSNIKLSGFTCKIKLTSADYLTYCNNQDVDFSKSLLKVVLKRDGQQFVLIQDDLRTLGLESNLFSMSRRAFYQDHAWQVTMVSYAPAIHGETLLCFDIDLGGILDIKGTDELQIECSLQSGFFSGDVLTTGSYLEFKPIKSIGFEKYVPYIRTYAISAGERRKSWDLGGNVMRLTLLNFGYGSHVVPSVSTVTLGTSKLDETFTFSDLVASRLINRPDQGDGSGASINAIDEFDQCFVIIEDTELQRVSLDVQFNPANVLANDNVLVVRSAYTDVRTLIEHDAKVQQAQNELISEMKQNGENAKI